MNETTVYAIDQLAFEWTKAKNAEMYANLSRIEIEKKILALFEPKEEGIVTKNTDFYKVSCTFSIDRKVDSDIARSLAIQLGDEYERIFKWEAKIDTKEMRFLIDKKPEVYALCARAITSKPRKPSLKIEEVSK